MRATSFTKMWADNYRVTFCCDTPCSAYFTPEHWQIFFGGNWILCASSGQSVIRKSFLSKKWLKWWLKFFWEIKSEIVLAYRYSKLRKKQLLVVYFLLQKRHISIIISSGFFNNICWPKMSIILSTTLQSVNSFLQAFGLKEARQEKKSQKNS